MSASLFKVASKHTESPLVPLVFSLNILSGGKSLHLEGKLILATHVKSLAFRFSE